MSRTLHPGGPFFFGNKERAVGSPLGEQLFALPGVTSVLIAESVVTICKEPAAPEIEEIIDTTNHAAGKKPFYPRHEKPL